MVFYEQNPATISDICTILIAKTNLQEKWIQSYIYERSKEEDIEYIWGILYQVPQIDPRVFLFSNLSYKNISFLTVLFQEYLDYCKGDCSVDDFCFYLKKEEVLLDSFGRYYFDADKAEKRQLLDLIFTSTISGEKDLRAKLFEFISFTECYAKVLTQTIKEVEKVLIEIQEKSVKSICSAQENFEYKEFVSQLGEDEGIDSEDLTICISFSVVNKYGVWRQFLSDKVLYILGIDYQFSINELNESHIDLTEFGNAIGDRTRKTIIDLIIRNKEMAVRDIIRNVNAAPTTVMYHLNILKTAKVLRNRNQGKKVIYWLNVKQYRLAIQKLIEEINLWEGKET